jgi:hypothetical protein
LTTCTSKDHKNSKEDLKELGIRPELYAEEIEMGTNLPVATTTLSKAGRKEFYQFLHDLKVPSGYSSNFKRLESVKDMKMNFNLMKSHGCHVLMTALLHVALRGIKTKLVRDAVTSRFLGPSYLHHMFPYERFFGLLKSLVRTGYFWREPLFVAMRHSKQWSGPWVIWNHKSPLV